MPSVFLNIRGPVADIDSRLVDLAPAAPEDILTDMGWRDPDLWTYEPLKNYDALFGRIPIVPENK